MSRCIADGVSLVDPVIVAAKSGPPNAVGARRPWRKPPPCPCEGLAWRCWAGPCSPGHCISGEQA